MTCHFLWAPPPYFLSPRTPAQTSASWAAGPSHLWSLCAVSCLLYLDINSTDQYNEVLLLHSPQWPKSSLESFHNKRQHESTQK